MLLGPRCIANVGTGLALPSLDAPLHIARAIAGHSHIDVTMMIYAHSGMTEQAEALRKLGEAFGSTG